MQATRICPVRGCPDPQMVRWLPVVDDEGLYEIHSHGDVRRVGRAARNGNGHGGGARIGHVLKPHEVDGHYLVVQLWSDGKPRMRLIHLLVAAAFLGPCPDGKEVNHEDGDKHNNCAGNFEYVTHAENQLHAYRTGLRPTVLSVRQVLELRDRAATGERVRLLAAEFGISRSSAYAAIRGDTHKHLRGAISEH